MEIAIIGILLIYSMGVSLMCWDNKRNCTALQKRGDHWLQKYMRKQRQFQSLVEHLMALCHMAEISEGTDDEL